MSSSNERVLLAGAAAYAQSFRRVPPATRSELEAELEDLETSVRNAITAALWSHPYDAFVAAVRQQLLKPV